MKAFLPALAAIFLVAIGLSPPGEAQETTFQVEAITGGEYPSGFAFVIDGVPRDTLTLIRGETYHFEMNSVSGIHFFYISTSAIGADGGDSAWDDDVEGNGANGNETLTFVVPEEGELPPLYYQCWTGGHGEMGAPFNIVNPSDTEEGPAAAFDLSVLSQNPGADRVTVGLALAEAGEVSVEVFDVRGRRVGVLHEGALAAGDDHRFQVGANLRPGVYVVRATDGERTAELSVTLVR